MCDCISSPPLSFSTFKIRTSDLKRCPAFSTYISIPRNGGFKLRATKNSRQFYSELGFKEKGEGNLELESRMGSDKETDSGILELKERIEEEDLIRVGESNEIDESREVNEEMRLSRRRQVIRRSNLLAKQVISVQSALSLGFVSQIWVDVDSWMVLVVEVRPNLLSGESERFLLEDVRRVGDVILVEDENVLDSELKMVGLETLVGYSVVTPGRRYIGKVRGYSFNVNSGAVEMLELDSFGISIIPSSLVSTYALPIEDVLEVFSDTVIVHEAAASRIRRLTKGFWDAQKVGTSIGEIDEFSGDKFSIRSDHHQSTRRSSHNQKSHPKVQEFEEDWELPMDYL